MASQITGVSIVYSTVCQGADQTKHQSSAPLAFARGIKRNGEFPTQRASNSENASIWWRHHVWYWGRIIPAGPVNTMGAHMVQVASPVPVKEPWRIWVKRPVPDHHNTQPSMDRTIVLEAYCTKSWKLKNGSWSSKNIWNCQRQTYLTL